jgi:hypothetical protein
MTVYSDNYTKYIDTPRVSSELLVVMLVTAVLRTIRTAVRLAALCDTDRSNWQWVARREGSLLAAAWGSVAEAENSPRIGYFKSGFLILTCVRRRGEGNTFDVASDTGWLWERPAKGFTPRALQTLMLRSIHSAPLKYYSEWYRTVNCNKHSMTSLPSGAGFEFLFHPLLISWRHLVVHTSYKRHCHSTDDVKRI